MIKDEKSRQVSEILELLGEELDISESKYFEAEKRYNAIGEWLRRSDSSIRGYTPEIYVQGSFRLGTVIKPASSDGDYDIDCVCVLQLAKHHCTQKQLKDAVGKEIIKYAIANSMQNKPQEGKRCWTLKYADGSNFHIDVLPAIPYSKSFRTILESKGFNRVNTDDAIAITDNTTYSYNIKSDDWKVSNPKGYANWFKNRMEIVSKSIFDESMKLSEQFGSLEEVPIYRLKTPLQKVVQILKRHRDLIFSDSDDKPISIIITTLSAQAYSNETDILEALINIVKNMKKYILKKEGIYWVSNPVNPLENFADKWGLYKSREKAFFSWITKLEKIINELTIEYDGLDKFSETLNRLVENNVVQNVMEKYGSRVLEKRKLGELKAEKRSGILNTNLGTRIKDHTFYGK